MIKANKKITAILGLSVFSMMISIDANAEIFKCINSKAEVYYNDKPCPVSEVERKMKAVKDPVGGYIAPTTFVSEKAIAKRKFVVVGKEGSSVGNNTNSNFDSKNENGASQNLDSQAGTDVSIEYTAGSNNNSYQSKSIDGVKMTKQQYQNRNSADNTH